MRPKDLQTKIFLDSGDPNETKQLFSLLGFLDGQTTNPSLIAKNPDVQGKRFSKQEISELYKSVVQEIAIVLPNESISIEVYADLETTAAEMITQAKEMYSWADTACIKLPITTAGLQAAEKLSQEGMRLNMTLCFSQEQAAAVYSATQGATKGSVYISPFDGRLDDIAYNGMDVIENIIRMYEEGDGHVEVLAASIRNVNHLLYAIHIGANIVTVPGSVLRDWAALDMRLPSITMPDLDDAKRDIQNIPYQELDLRAQWQSFDIQHDLTDQGLTKFAEDWNELVED